MKKPKQLLFTLLSFHKACIIVFTKVVIDGNSSFRSSGGPVRIKPAMELPVIDILAILLVIIIAAWPTNTLRVVLGLPVILFFPGYALIGAIFPRRSDLKGVERLALSFGLSIAVAPLIGLILNYTPWSISLYSILVSLTIFILVASAVAWYRRLRLPVEESFWVAFNVSLLGWAKIGRWDKAFTVVILVLILGAIGSLAYAMATPTGSEGFTEFYMLGIDGKAENYPRELAVGEEGKVILGIVNHEREDNLTYRVVITINGETIDTIGPLVLENNEKWENEVSFSLRKVGEDRKVEFLLFKEGEAEPYKSLYIWLDVNDRSWPNFEPGAGDGTRTRDNLLGSHERDS